MTKPRCSDHLCDREATFIIDGYLYCTHHGVARVPHPQPQPAEDSA